MNRPAAEQPAAQTDADDDVAAGSRNRHRVRFELIFAGIWFAVGLLVVPATIFAVGGALLGPYDDNSRLGRFYGDFFGDLAEPSVRAWAIALGPLVLISLLRLVFAGTGRPGRAAEEPQEQRPPPPRRSPEESRRVEPRVSGD
jgi:hypothetical protein